MYQISQSNNDVVEVTKYKLDINMQNKIWNEWSDRFCYKNVVLSKIGFI